MRLRGTNEVRIKLHRDLRPRPTALREAELWFICQQAVDRNVLIAENDLFCLCDHLPSSALYSSNCPDWLDLFIFLMGEKLCFCFFLVCIVINIYPFKCLQGRLTYLVENHSYPSQVLPNGTCPSIQTPFLTAAASSDKKFLKYLRILKASLTYSIFLHYFFLDSS